MSTHNINILSKLWFTSDTFMTLCYFIFKANSSEPSKIKWICLYHYMYYYIWIAYFYLNNTVFVFINYQALEEVTEVHKMLPKVKGHQPNDQSTPFDNILSAIQNVTKNTETQTAITKLNKKLGELQRSNEAPKCLKALGLETLEAGPWVLQALAQYITCARRQEDRCKY